MWYEYSGGGVDIHARNGTFRDIVRVVETHFTVTAPENNDGHGLVMNFVSKLYHIHKLHVDIGINNLCKSQAT